MGVGGGGEGMEGVLVMTTTTTVVVVGSGVGRGWRPGSPPLPTPADDMVFAVNIALQSYGRNQNQKTGDGMNIIVSNNNNGVRGESH